MQTTETVTFAGDSESLKRTMDFYRGNPQALDRLADDPAAVMAQFGVAIDDETAKAIKANAQDRAATPAPQASIIHADG
jgi:hypothetical protein